MRKLRREEKRRRDFERQFGAGFHGDDNGMLAPVGGRGPWTRSEYESDAGSVFSSEDDVWGADIGGYNEYNPAFPPPPLALPAEAHTPSSGGDTLGQDEMAAILDSGWDEPAPRLNGFGAPHGPSPLHRGAFAPDPPAPMRYAPANGAGGYDVGSYVPIESPRTPGASPNTGDSVSSSVDSRLGGSGHAKKRSGGRTMGDRERERYGPMGPLSGDDTGWGGRSNGAGKRV